MHPSPKREVHVTLGIRGFYSPQRLGVKLIAQMADFASEHAGKYKIVLLPKDNENSEIYQHRYLGEEILC